jgi:DNA-binding MarR family transcriptional regulator
MPRRTRAHLESQIVADVQALSAESDDIGRAFATREGLGPNDFRALLHVMVAESAGAPLSAGELGQRVGVSGAAITYLVERMIDSGHLRREAHPTDRRKVLLRYGEHGRAVARSFFTPLEEHTTSALNNIPDADLKAAHRVLAAVISSMREFRADLGYKR